MPINYNDYYVLAMGVVLSQLPSSYVRDLLFKQSVIPNSVVVDDTSIKIHFHIDDASFFAIWDPKAATVNYRLRLPSYIYQRLTSEDRWAMEIQAAMKTNTDPRRIYYSYQESFRKIYTNFPSLLDWSTIPRLVDAFPENLQ